MHNSITMATKLWYTIMLLGSCMFAINFLAFYLSHRRDNESAISPEAGNRIRAFGEPATSCVPVRNLYFLRIPKTGSSTLANILCRYALKQGIKVLTSLSESPVRGDQMMESSVSRLQDRDHGRINANKFIIYQHTEFNASEVPEQFPQDVTIITMLREPFQHFKSVFNYLHLASRFHLGEKSDPFEAFLKLPEYYDSAALTRNMLSRPFGVEAQTKTELRRLIAMIHSQFSAVLLNGYFEETLVLLADKLCLEFADLFFVNLKTMTYRQKRIEYDRELHLNHRNWSPSDYVLHSYFHQKVEQEIKKTGHSLQSKVHLLKQINKQIEHICEDVCGIWLKLVDQTISIERAHERLTTPMKLNSTVYNFPPLDCLQYTVDESVMMKAINVYQNQSPEETNMNDVIMRQICVLNGLCQPEMTRTPSLLRHFLRLARNYAFTFPIQWCEDRTESNGRT